MNFKDILNYPLLRGERAERWAAPLVENPAITVAVATAAFSGIAVIGPWATFGLAAAFTLQLDRFLFEGALAAFSRLSKKPTPEETEAVWDSKYNHAANSVRTFIQAAATRDWQVSSNLRYQDNLGSATTNAEGGHINLNFARLCQGDIAPEVAADRGKFIAAHELGHLYNMSYTRLVAGHVAQRVAMTVAPIGAVMFHVGAGLTSTSVSSAFLAVVGTMLATAMAQRQEEHRADRHAIKMTGNPAVGQEVIDIKQTDSGLPPTVRPSLLINCLHSHPCTFNRTREMRYYDNQLAEKRQKSPNHQ